MSVDELRAAAVRYRTAGWPIVPVCLRTGTCLRSTPPADPQDASELWSGKPYGIACSTGSLFDALQVPRWLGERVLPGVEHHAAVFEQAGSLGSAWFFLVTPGAPGVDGLYDDVMGVRLHGAGSSVLLPPTPSVHWVSRQSELRLAASVALQQSVVRAIGAARRGRPWCLPPDG